MNIKLIAQNAIKITTNEGNNVYFDPFNINESTNDADVIFITHAHFDHFSPEDIKKIRNEKTKIIVTKDLIEKTIQCGFDEKDILKVLPNNKYEFADIKFTTIPAYNVNKSFHKREYDWVSYIVGIDDNEIYVAGDTDITEEALNVKCDIALVPVGGTYTMTADEAAKLVEYILPRKYAVPTHYQTVVGTLEDALRFQQLLNGKMEVQILMK